MRWAVTLVAAVLPGLAGFAAFAFAHWNANPADWDSVSRGSVAFLAMFAGPMFGFLVGIHPDWDDRK